MNWIDLMPMDIKSHDILRIIRFSKIYVNKFEVKIMCQILL